ncbi:MAG: oligosaccharide flippase family protein [Bacteroidetes bacterium]|nr:oligosaccharide flippase family protein [Bacteroidota bacterium]
MSVGRKAGKGFLSFLYRSTLEKIMGVIAMIFLARKLTPYDFGLVSITEVLLYLISVLGTTGLAEFLLAYRKDDTEEIFKSAFWFNIVVTLAIFLLFLVFVPVWAHYQHDDRILNIGWIVGLIFIFSQLQLIPKAWLSKNLQFDKQVKIQTPFIILIPIGKIVAVMLGWGVYSLLLPTLIFQPILTLLLYANTGVKISLKLYLNRWREIYHFTKHLIGATIFSRITDQGDKFILGKFLGLDKLGIYNIAFQLAELVTSQLVQVSNNVLSSVFPKYADDKETFYTHYSSFLKTFAFIIFPPLAIMFLSAKPIILLLYGPQWLEAVLPLKILVIAAAFKAVSSSYGSVMNTFHLNKKSLIVTLVYAPFHIGGSIAGSYFGVAGIATAVTTVKLVFINWNVKQIMDAFAKPFLLWYRALLPYFTGNVCVGLVLWLILLFTNGSVYPMITIIVTGVLFVILYTLTFRMFFKSELKQVSSFLGITFPASSKCFKLLFSA